MPGSSSASKLVGALVAVGSGLGFLECLRAFFDFLNQHIVGYGKKGAMSAVLTPVSDPCLESHAWLQGFNVQRSIQIQILYNRHHGQRREPNLSGRLKFGNSALPGGSHLKPRTSGEWGTTSVGRLAVQPIRRG